jgi:UDP-N-acetylmuramoyl-L-alanyl-D-glutamate--2,6-diaminopimelate ligase
MIPLGTLLDGLEARWHGCGPETRVESATTDSRHAGAGVAFVAIAGANHDGHAFAEAALAAGAPVVIASAGKTAVTPLVEVEDTHAALPRIAANLYRWPARALRLAGITGTNGKTTTTHLLGAILDAAERPHARLGTTGNWMVDHEAAAAFTTPFPLELQALLAQARERGASDVVMEVSSHALDQDRVEPLRYQAVALTSFSQDHLDYHPDMEAYLQAKLRLPGHFLDHDGTVVAPIDGGGDFGDAGRRFLAAAPPGARRLGVSKRDEADAAIAATAWSISPAGIDAALRTPAGPLVLGSPLVGEYNLDNLMVAAGLALGLGVGLDAIARGLAHTRGAPGRLQQVAVEGVDGPAVFVDYAHTPDAVARALDALRPTCQGRLVVLLGCGGDRDQSKRPLMGRAASEKADLFYATSDNPRTEDPDRIVDQMLSGVAEGRPFVREVDRRAAIARAIAEAEAGDTVLIAGKGHEDYQILGTSKIHFDDCEEAASALRARG